MQGVAATTLLLTIVFSGFSAQGQSDPCPPVIAYGDTALCVPGPVQLNASPGFTNYHWSPAIGLSDTTIQNPVATFSGVITYVVTATGFGPNLMANPDFSLGNVGFTSGLTYSTVYTPGNYYVAPLFFTYSWPEMIDHTPTSDGFMMAVDGSLSEKMLYQQTIAVDPGTDYNFEFWCTRADVHQPIFEIHFVGDVTGDVIMATTPGIPYAPAPLWEWDAYGVPSWNSGPNSSVTIHIRNLELDYVGNDFALDDFSFRTTCTVSDSVTILVGNIAANITGPLNICEGQAATLTANGGQLVNWSTGETTPSLLISPVTVTTYTAIVSDTTGCADTVSHTVAVFPFLNAGVTSDSVICLGEPGTLTAQGGTMFSWSTGETGETVSVTPTTPTTYTVIVSDAGKCADTAAYEVIPVDCSIILEMPNIFTPNADGLNDNFVPIKMNNIVRATLFIFNRWGQLMHETTDLLKGWNGKFKEDNCSDGVYYWVVEYTDIQETQKEIKGFLSLVRN
ncbi:MAG TPA: gliding motility-associated C-terminal domain-containing protein [Flavobacteriales bacterium]|nr:gliding motility-associated C-terminal domain-containing protein [Flavobacteriales bacterium]